MNSKEIRLSKANALIFTIASCGRKFFRHKDSISYFFLKNNKVWFVDCYTQKAIYTHYNGRWRFFTQGGTMKSLVAALRDYISKDIKLAARFGPWPDYMCGGDVWGYGEDMEIVRKCAKDLDLLR